MIDAVIWPISVLKMRGGCATVVRPLRPPQPIPPNLDRPAELPDLSCVGGESIELPHPAVHGVQSSSATEGATG